ncbi:hypothetical protein SUGI_0050080 [Cryptomeria japonica]|uniref:uncharacterized protein LOC131069094 n=1 Tax=Cryptomeria japonica TaxID=3369 RepID=UPI0024089CCA|nr:uncharacterized protein LOC131069094 [Cryptomeria japonica]GLJ06843.1 hypothetical protein SUGI_0050080 [Cryptomeria japonica]
MEKFVLKFIQIPFAPGISCDHKKWDSGSSIKPISCGYGANCNFKGTSLKPTLFTGKRLGITNKRGLLWVHDIRATGSPNSGGGNAPGQGKQNNDLFPLFAGIFANLFRLGQKKSIEKIEEKVENTVEIVEEVANAAKEVASVTEDLAETVEKQSKEGSIVYKTAQNVDEISKEVGKDAEIVEKQVEKVQKAINTMNEKVGKAEDVLKDIEEIISQEKKTS